MTVDDAAAIAEMRRLASPLPGDAVIVAGESATCGLAGLTAALRQPGSAAALGLSPSARVMVFGSEGDTDVDLYQRLILSS